MFPRLICRVQGHQFTHTYNLHATAVHPERSEWRCTRCTRIELRPGWVAEPGSVPSPHPSVAMSPEQAEVTRCAVRAWQYLEDHPTKENFLLRARLQAAITAVGLIDQPVSEDVPELDHNNPPDEVGVS